MAGKNYSKKQPTQKRQVHIEEKIELLNSQIAPEIIGENVFEQRKIDTILKENKRICRKIPPKERNLLLS